MFHLLFVVGCILLLLQPLNQICDLSLTAYGITKEKTQTRRASLSYLNPKYLVDVVYNLLLNEYVHIGNKNSVVCKDILNLSTS